MYFSCCCPAVEPLTVDIADSVDKQPNVGRHENPKPHILTEERR